MQRAVDLMPRDVDGSGVDTQKYSEVRYVVHDGIHQILNLF